MKLARELSGVTKAGVLFFSGSSLDRIRETYFRFQQTQKKYGYFMDGEDIHMGHPCSWQIWDRHTVVDNEFFFPIKMCCYYVLRPWWGAGKAFKAANAALGARFEHGEVFK